MNLYLRLMWLLLRIAGLARRGVLEESRVTFRVLSNDCDLNLPASSNRKKKDK